MKIIVGLGNPGSQYTSTRHNCGFMVVDRLVKKFAPAATVRGRFNSATVEADIGGEKCLLMKPTTYMNRSGIAAGEAAGFFKVDITRDFIVITDDLALPVGAIRLRPGGGAGGHNGLEDLRRALGSETFPRLRVGIGSKPAYMDQADYVLSRFTEIEEPALESSLEKAALACETFITKGLDAAMNQANAPPPDPNRPKRPPEKPGPAETSK